jgi:antitoxin FitA
MPINLSIKNAPDDLVAALKIRAQRNHRSMQREVLTILETAVREPRPLTPDEILAKVRRLGLRTPAEAADMIRKDRDSR